MCQLPTDPKRRALMQRVRRSGTTAENRVAAFCREFGLSYRRNVGSLPGSPDLANKSRRWAIFVNGCFWHSHTGCAKATTPKRNSAFWSKKFRENRSRDARKIWELRALGYCVLLMWECEVTQGESVRRRISNLRKSCFIDSA